MTDEQIASVIEAADGHDIALIGAQHADLHDTWTVAGPDMAFAVIAAIMIAAALLLARAVEPRPTG